MDRWKLNRQGYIRWGPDREREEKSLLLLQGSRAHTRPHTHTMQGVARQQQTRRPGGNKQQDSSAASSRLARKHRGADTQRNSSSISRTPPSFSATIETAWQHSQQHGRAIKEQQWLADRGPERTEETDLKSETIATRVTARMEHGKCQQGIVSTPWRREQNERVNGRTGNYDYLLHREQKGNAPT